MSYESIVADFLSKGGEITKCPPRTFTQDAATGLHWKDQQAIARRAQQRQRKFERAEPADKAGEQQPMSDEAIRRAAQDRTQAEAAALLGISVKQMGAHMDRLDLPRLMIADLLMAAKQPQDNNTGKEQ